MTVVPGYKTDAIFRINNIDRYDDRDIVEENLIESYDRLMSFCLKHMDNRFILDGDISVDARELIIREVIGNILIHRDYTNAFPAKLIIDKEALRTENWSKSRFNGKLNIDSFTPYPKNPLIASFFVNIGRADTLGSGMRNLYKYTKLYSNEEPILLEGDVFKTIIPLRKSDIGVSKSDIGASKSDIGVKTQKITLEQVWEECAKYSYKATVKDNIIKIYNGIDSNQFFGASDIKSILGCANSTASDMIKRLNDMKLVIKVQGKGKGKYRWRFTDDKLN